jgi:hypothetical protein
MSSLPSNCSSSSSSSSINARLLTAYLWCGAVGPVPSILLYAIVPSGTVEYFNGTPSTTAAFWCSTNAATDATIVFLCWYALFFAPPPHQAAIQVLVVRTFAVYAVFHWGAFWYWSHYGDAHPAYIRTSYPVSILISLAACLWWGFLHPPTSAALSSSSRPEQPYETLHNVTETRATAKTSQHSMI